MLIRVIRAKKRKILCTFARNLGSKNDIRKT